MIKKLLPIVLLLLCCNSASFGNVFDDLSSLEKDSYVHFGAGVLVSHVSYPFFVKCCHDRKNALLYSLGLTALLSFGKEVYDANSSGFNGGDLAAGLLGGCTIFVVTF